MMAPDEDSPDDSGRIRKRSVLVAGHQTSVSLEAAFWSALKDIAGSRGTSVNTLVSEVDDGRNGNLSSALRVFVLDHFRGRTRLRPRDGRP